MLRLPPSSHQQLNGTEARQKLTTDTPMTLIITAETRFAVLDEAGSSSVAQSLRCHGRPFGTLGTLGETLAVPAWTCRREGRVKQAC